MSEWHRYLLYRFILGGAVLACVFVWWLWGKARRAIAKRHEFPFTYRKDK